MIKNANKFLKKIATKLIDLVSNIIIRYYMEIIAGVWAVIIMMPLDNYFYEKYTGVGTYVIDRNYVNLFVIYTIFFVGLGELVPVIRKRKVRIMLNNFLKKNIITLKQKNKITDVINHSSACQSIFSKYGFMQFIMKNLFSIGVTFSYFAAEGFIVKTMYRETIIVPTIFTIFFITLLLLEHILDQMMANKMRKENIKHKKENIEEKYGANKMFMTYILDGVRGSNLSDKVSQVVYEEIIGDISRIMSMKDDNDEAKLVRNVNKKTAIPKGKIEKAKQGINIVKQKKKPVAKKKTKKKNKR